MSFIPNLCEIGVVTAVAPKLWILTYLKRLGLSGSGFSAVVVPLMIRFIEEKRGAKKGIPTLVLAGSSCDDAVAIVVFTSVLSIYLGSGVSLTSQIASIPISVITGIVAGGSLGLVFYYLFKRFDPVPTKRIMLLIATALSDGKFQEEISEFVPFSRFNINYDNWLRYPRKKSEFAAHEISQPGQCMDIRANSIIRIRRHAG